MNTPSIGNAPGVSNIAAGALQDLPGVSSSVPIGPGLSASVAEKSVGARPEKYIFKAASRSDSESASMEGGQVISLLLADNHVSEYAHSVHELLRYQLDMINTVALALATGNRASVGDMNGPRRAVMGGYQRLESAVNAPQLGELTQKIADAMIHLEQDRNATAVELRTAGRLRGKLKDLIAGEYRRNGLSYCQAEPVYDSV